MPNLTNLLAGIASSVASQVGGAVTSVLGYIVDGVNKDIIKPVSTGIGDALSAVEHGVSSLQQAASNGINNTLNAAAHGIETIIATAEVGFNNVLGGVESGIQLLASSISTVFHEVVKGVEQGFTAVEQGVGQAITKTAELVEKGLHEAGQIMASTLTTVLTPIAHFLESLPATIEAIAGDVVDGVKDLGRFAERQAVAYERYVERNISGYEEMRKKDHGILDFLKLFEPMAKEGIHLVGSAAGVEITPELGIALGKIAAIAAAENAIGGIEELFPGAAFIMASLINHIADSIAIGDFRTLDQAGNAGTPNQIIGIGDLVDGKYKKVITDEYYFDTMRKHGISNVNADILFKVGDGLLQLNSLVQLYRRGEIKTIEELYTEASKVRAGKFEVDGTLKLYDRLLDSGSSIEMWRRGITPEGWTDSFDDLRAQGYTDNRIDAMKKISKVIPNIFQYQDLVARKVDDEEHVKKFNLDFGINDEYFEIAKAHGYDEKTAKRLYRMYWELPPFFAIVSEYKQGKLSETDFRDAMSFLRFTPHWQDVFADSLKPNLSQGEIKDMYKFEVIEADEIVPKLVAIGTPQSLAEQLSELWQASVKNVAPQDRTGTQHDAHALKGETASLITTAYKDSLMNSAEAEAQLIALGKTEEAAKLILAIADHDIHQQNIKDVFAIDKDQYLNGNITLEDVVTDLAQAGATQIQQTKFLNQLQRAGRSKPKMPTLADFHQWFKKQIIDASELVAGLQLLGYADTWIPFYLLEAGVKAEAVAAMGYNIGVPTQP